MAIAVPQTASPKAAPSWSRLLRTHGPGYLDWLARKNVLVVKFDLLARALSQLLEGIQTPEEARDIWKATPAVLHRCNEQGTYEMSGAPLAYAWLHLLERYARTWVALEQLVKHGYLPIARFGVRTLDVGTGPGPSAFAINDFYHSLMEFGAEEGIEALKQPPSITCVEFDPGANHVRNLMAEILFVLSESKEPTGLWSGFTLNDFGVLKPREERKDMQQRLRWEEERSWDPIEGHDAYDRVYTADEANDIAQSMHRYRLIVFSNFLTTVGMVEKFEPSLVEVFADAQPGCVIVVLGARGGPYDNIYTYVDGLAIKAGFRVLLQNEEVSTVGTAIADRIFREGKKIYLRLQELSPNDSDEIDKVRKRYSADKHRAVPTWMRAYRKYGHHRLRQ